MAMLAVLVGIALACAPKIYRFDMDGAGAIYTYLVPPDPELPARAVNPIRMPLEVILDDALRNAYWQHAIGADRHRFPIGEGLAAHLGAVARNVFPEAVDVTKPSGSHPVLRPRVVDIQRTIPPNPPLGLSQLTVVLEWRLERADGGLVWVETVEATGESGGDRLALTERDQMHELYRLLFAASQRELEDAAEIRAFAAAPSALGSGAASPEHGVAP